MIAIKSCVDMLIEEINKVAGEVIGNDLHKGKMLLQLCGEYKMSEMNLGVHICLNNGHKQQVLKYMNDINLRYSALIRLYNLLNNSNSTNTNTNNNELECVYLKNYVDFLEKVKMAKDASDNIDKVIKIMKGEIYE